MAAEVSRRSFIRGSAAASAALVASGGPGTVNTAADATAAQGRRVYRNYTQRQLDRAYSQDYWVAYSPNEAVDFYSVLSAKVREDHRFSSHRYGRSKVESLDFFPCGKPGRPVHIFIHGGAWLGLDKETSALGAPTFVKKNRANYVALNFSPVDPPKVTLADMVDQVRRGIAWVYQNAGRLKVNRDRIFLSGHSSGGHLASAALLADWSTYGVPQDVVKGSLLISGLYDLYPVSLSYRQGYLKLTDAEVEALSAIRHVSRIPCPIVVAYAGNDTPEFRRQSKAFAKALKRRSPHPSRLKVARGLNHYDISFTLGYDDAIMGNIALQQMGLAKPVSLEGPAGPIRY
jgi:arylformamidase